MKEEIFKVDTATAGKWEILLARVLGKRHIVSDDGWGMSYYSFRGKIYVTEYHDYEEDYHVGK